VVQLANQLGFTPHLHNRARAKGFAEFARRQFRIGDDVLNDQDPGADRVAQ
jgi:hypothetical protein